MGCLTGIPYFFTTDAWEEEKQDTCDLCQARKDLPDVKIQRMPTTRTQSNYSKLVLLNGCMPPPRGTLFVALQKALTGKGIPSSPFLFATSSRHTWTLWSKKQQSSTSSNRPLKTSMSWDLCDQSELKLLTIFSMDHQ